MQGCDGGYQFPDVGRLLNPRNIAVIGASESSYYGSRFCRNIISSGGSLYPISDKHAEVFGLKCFQEIEDTPNAIDHAIIILPAHKVLIALEQCIHKGVKSITIVSDVFAESGRRRSGLSRDDKARS